MALATGLASALLAIAVRAVGAEALESEVRCPSTPYGEAWGRASPSGAFQLCRVPATHAGITSPEYELRAGELLLWRLWLPRALDEAVVSDAGVVDGFANEDEPGSAPIAYIVTTSPGGVLGRDWRIDARQKWFVCGGEEPAVTEIARVDASRIAVRTGYDDLLILDASAATPVRTFDLHGLPFVRGESKRIVEWDVLPGGEVVAVRTAYSRYDAGTPTGPLGAWKGGHEDFGMRFFVVTSNGDVLWSTSELCLTVPVESKRTRLEAIAVREFREERAQRITVSADSRFDVTVRAEAPPLWIQVAKDPAGGWRVGVVGG